MATIAYHTVNDYLERTKPSAWPPVTLICGEEMLCKRVLDSIVDRLLPQSERGMGLETFDGAEDSIGAVMASLSTYAMLTRTKVVVLQDARIFYSAKTRQGLSEKMVQAARSGEMQKATRPFLNLMALSGLTFDDLNDPTHRAKIIEDVDGEPPPWFAQLIDHCRQKGLAIPDKRDDGDLLKAAMDEGFPDGHRLIISTDFVDRRKFLFKAIDEVGLVVDCTVPKGESRADRMAQDAVMQAAIEDGLAQSGKRLAVDARKRLIEWTGFDLRTLAGNVDKLISFVGDRGTITDADVTALLDRTRKDPIFEFTNAIADRDLPAVLFFMQSLLDDGIHPLQLLAAAANQIRRLLVAKSFIIRDRGRIWSDRMTFPRFKTTPFNAVKDDDGAFATLMEDWDAIASPVKQAQKRSKSTSSDLVMARNPKSPFPVFQTFKKADAFSLEGLASALIDLSDADLRMKSTGQDPRLLLETVLIRMCQDDAGGSKDDGQRCG